MDWATTFDCCSTIIAGMADQGPGFDVPILRGGDPSSPRALADRGYLTCLDAILGSEPGIEGSGRAALAERLADPANPWTARVMANRVWHYLFGTGLVRSVDNFGRLGDPLDAGTGPKKWDYPTSKSWVIGTPAVRDGVVYDGLWCSFNGCHMIELAQYTAEKAGLKRGQLDEFSMKSQQKAEAVIAECRFSKEIVEVTIGFDGIAIANSKSAKEIDLTLKDIWLALAKDVPDQSLTSSRMPDASFGNPSAVRCPNPKSTR